MKLLSQELLKEGENFSFSASCFSLKNNYNVIMKKFIICIIAMSFMLPSQAFFWQKKDKALEKELQGKGYAGNLPSIGVKEEKTKTKVAEPKFELQPGFDDPKELKPVPSENPAFINIIQKKDKVSEYANDVSIIIPMLEKLADCIEDEENLQLFISKANMLSMNIDHMVEKYNGQPESYYESFKKLMDVNRYVKSISTLRREAVTYQRFLAYTESGSIYNPENINQQLEYLKEEINTAVILLREEG